MGCRSFTCGNPAMDFVYITMTASRFSSIDYNIRSSMYYKGMQKCWRACQFNKFAKFYYAKDVHLLHLHCQSFPLYSIWHNAFTYTIILPFKHQIFLHKCKHVLNKHFADKTYHMHLIELYIKTFLIYVR